MRVLAIDSSGLVASVAVVEENNLIAEYTLNYKKTHSQTLLPMIDEMVSMLGIDLKGIDAIAIAKGPGSFTGLRIGSATAKGLGLALNKPIIPVPTVDALAFNLFGCASIICPIMDARRNQVYTGLYTFQDGKFLCKKEQEVVMLSDILKDINELQQSVIFLGDGVDVYIDQIMKEAMVDVFFAPAHMNKQRAGAVGTLAIEYYKEAMQSAEEHEPTYLRLSQAEREMAEKQGKSQC